MERQILVACIGNIFLGDDGFGTEVAQVLAGRSLPPEVTVKDFGIRGLDLVYALLEPHDLVILVDACARGGQPGTLYLLEPEPVGEGQPVSIDTHEMNPMNVLRTVKSMGGVAGRILVVGCEPADTDSFEDGQTGLSEPVKAAVAGAAALIESVVSKTLAGQPVGIAAEN
ncbi:MAG TPA: hydrogenase maturation protease [Bryobacteraceae bacterium]|jgi:hydrogenase maturation protease|nr:hydrogenase maturation protease [Bryobacteraceae bacterium]